MAPSSPFQRRPTLTRTYGHSSRRTSHPPNSHQPTRTSQANKGRKSILDGTDSEEEEQRVAESLLSPKQLGKDKAASTSSSSRATTTSKPPPLKLAPPPKPVARPAPARRTRSSTAADLPLPTDDPASTADSASPEKDDKGSTVWDEAAAVRAKPSPTKARATRRTSVRNGGGQGGEERAEASLARGTRDGSRSPAKRSLLVEEEGTKLKEAAEEQEEDEAPEPSSPPSRRKRTRLSLASPAALPTATGRAKGKGKELTTEKKEDEDAIPAPIKYVPLSERLKEAKKLAPPPAKPPARAPSPRLVRSRSARSSTTAVSAPLAKLPSPAPPAPTFEPPKPSASISTAAPPPVPAMKRPASPSRASSAKPATRPAPPPAQPPSPAKDLSSLFSRFSSAAPAASTSNSTAPSAATKMGLKRSASALDAGGGGGVVGRMKAGRKATVDERDKMMEMDEDSLSTGRRSPFPSPSRPALHPSHSFPALPSSPTRSPLHSSRFGSPSPSRPPLGSSLSFPVLPGRAESPTPSSPGASPRRRPVFPARASSGPSGLFPSYGLPSAASGFSSAFRAAAPAGATVAGGPTRTYAGGGRSFRRDVDEEALFAAPSTAVGRTKSGLSAVLEASSSPSGSAASGGLPSLPPSLRRPLLPAASTAPRETYATLRHKWGIDAEESLNAEVFESQESQDRGGRVEGGEALRKRGEGKRWGDEVGFLLEGLKDGREDEGAASASALDLLRKLLDRDWLRRLKASGMAEQVYLAVRRAGAGQGRDRVLDTALAVLLALLLRDQRLSEPLLRLSPADLARSSASSSSPRKRKGSGLSSPAGSRPGSPATLSRQNSYGFSQSQGEDADPSSSFPSFSSSPRKPLGGRDSYPYSQSQSQNQSQSQLGADLLAAALDDRCDVLEVLKAFLGGGIEEGDLEDGGVEWGGEEIGAAKTEGEGEDEGKGKGKKAARRERGDGRHLQALRDIIDESELFAVDAGLPVTLQSLSLHALRSLASYTPRAIFQPQQLLCASGAFALVVRRGLVEECEKIGKRVEGFEKGLDLLPPVSSISSTTTAAPSVPTLFLTLSALELTSTSSPLAFPCLSAPDLLPLVASSFSELTLFAQLLLFSSTIDTDKEHGRQLLVAALGALYGLTTEAEWSAALVEADERKGRKRGELVEVLGRTVVAARRAPKASTTSVPGPKREEQDAQVLDGAEQDGEREIDPAKQQLWDVLSLSLGVLANVLDSVGDEEGVKEMMRETAINPDCTSRRRCARTCACPAEKKQPLLKILASLACDPMSDAPNTVYHTSTTGFLRLVLGFSMLSNPRNEQLVLDVLLPSPSSPSPSSVSPVSAADGRQALLATLDALDDLAKIQEQQQQARRMLLEGPVPDEDGEVEMAETQPAEEEEEEPKEVRRNEADEGEELARGIREMVGRLRRRVEVA